MGKITIRFYEFSFLVHSADRLTILFPEPEHRLVLKITGRLFPDGRLFPVPSGTTLELRDSNGQSLPLKATEMTEYYKKRMLDVSDIEPVKFTIDEKKIDPKERPKDTVAAKLHLSGGELDGLPCSIEYYRDKEYEFGSKKKKSMITDLVEFTLKAAQGTTYQLFMNDKFLRTIDDNDVLEFNNADLLGASKRAFHDMAEYVKLLKSAAELEIAVPGPAGPAVRADGIDNVCANARLQLS